MAAGRVDYSVSIGIDKTNWHGHIYLILNSPEGERKIGFYPRDKGEIVLQEARLEHLIEVLEPVNATPFVTIVEEEARQEVALTTTQPSSPPSGGVMHMSSIPQVLVPVNEAQKSYAALIDYMLACCCKRN
jgi:hypothetical protein